MKRLLVTLVLLTNTLPLSGCVTLGPKVEKKTVYVSKYTESGVPIKIGTVDKNVKVPLRFIAANGEEYTEAVNIGGFNVSPPALPEPPLNAANQAILDQYVKR